MAEYLGSAAVIQWIYPVGTADGTIALSADYRTFSFNPTAEKVDASAGSDANRVYLVGVTDYTVSYQGVAQSGGTALRAALQAGISGTLVFYPEGTAAGKPVYTFPCTTTTDSQTSWGYNSVAEVNIEWMAKGAYTIA